MSLRPISIATLSVCLATSGVASAQEILPKALIDRIERQMIMPQRDTTVADYQRFYALGERDGYPYVFVLFLQLNPSGREFVPEDAVPVTGRANAYVMPSGQLPVVFDGGCSVVTANYDVQAQRLRTTQSILSMLGEPDEKQTGSCNGMG